MPAAPAHPVSVVWDERFLEYDFGPDHPFTEESRRLAVQLLRAGGAFASDGLALVDRVTPATERSLRRFHRAEYLQRLAAVSAMEVPPLLDGGDTPGFPGCLGAAAILVGGTLEAERIVREQHRHAVQPGGGLHHAAPGAASGFCILNDLAVTIANALEERRYSRIAYVDIDAHQGDGVMYGFYADGRVLAIDVHQDGRTLFPGTGAAEETGTGDGKGLKVNLPLAPGAGDAELSAAAREVIAPLLEEFRPELIVLQHGVDGHAGDPLAQLRYTRRGYRAVWEAVHRAAHSVSEGRLLVTGGGGYSAAHVSRVLAELVLYLPGASPRPEGAEPLPAGWRAEFEARMGRPAPKTWADGAASTPVGPPGPEFERMREALARAHGRRFPSRDPALR
jgi:acetoin utilization protein AcuC